MAVPETTVCAVATVHGMDSTPTNRLPATLLIVITAVVAICGLPAAVMFLLVGVTSGSIRMSLALGAPALIAYAAAIWLYIRARRPGPAGRAWLLATLGAVLVVGASATPVVIIGKAILGEWQETQPGGRGYSPPPTPR
jgi:hypothetical protein